jgi:asparagine synthase (glutamine-hydrolysing)
MCGIAGWYDRSGRPVDRRVLERMNATLIHRGPDAAGIWLEGPLGLAHRRLAIRDLSPNGQQPMCDASGRVVVTYNGEIYNDQELRTTLGREFGFSFRTTCDTEVLPYAYLAWGEAMFERLEGMYAIALWDRETECLVLARDGIGIKPLYFAETSESVLFGSEVKAVLAHGNITPTLSPDSLHTFFAAGHAGTAASLITGVEQVAPGSLIAFSRNERWSRRFWKPHRRGQLQDLEIGIDSLSRILDEVIDGQLISDVPLGVLQSGGIDSSIVSLAVARHGVSVPLFTAAFEDKSYDETDLAAQVARATALPHRIIPMARAAEVDAAFRSVVYHFDGQCADTGALAFYWLSQAVRPHSKVVLSGDGGDEFFGGYATYGATEVAETLRQFVPAGLARALGRAAYRLNPGDERRLPAAALLARFGLGFAEGGAHAHLEWRRLIPKFLLPRIYGTELADLALASPFGEYACYYDDGAGSGLDRAMIADQRFHLQSVLAKVDAMSMAHGLEVRVPLLDRRIMDLAGGLALSLLHPSRRRPKYLLRKFAERLGAPREVTTGPKRGFNAPISQLLRGPLRLLADQVLDRDADILAPFLRADGVRQLWRAHRERRANHAFALWPILTVATWRAGLGQPQETCAEPVERSPDGIAVYAGP